MREMTRAACVPEESKMNAEEKVEEEMVVVVVEEEE